MNTIRALQILFIVLFVLAAVRLVIVMRKRAQPAAKTTGSTTAPPLNREAYVVPKQLHISTLKSAEQLKQQPVWAKEGFRYTVYPYVNRAADFKHPAGMLQPIQKLQIKEVTTATLPNYSYRQVLAVFDEDGKTYAVPIGMQGKDELTIYADEMFFYEDPRELYNFWTAETWQAIERHEVTKGMNEYQAAFAVGMGVPQPSGDSSQKTVNYPNGGKPLVVTYRNGKVIDIQPGKS